MAKYKVYFTTEKEKTWAPFLYFDMKPKKYILKC